MALAALATLVGAVRVAAGVGAFDRDDAGEDSADGGPPPPTDQEPMAAVALTTTTAPTQPTVVADPLSETVLVNHWWRLPPGWEPPDLVEPDVRFTFAADDPKRLLREPAARALEELFAAAEAAGVPLAAFSGYRSETKQADLFGLAVAERGEAEAIRHQARAGHSEHQTGLAIDVTGADGRCPAEACFAATPAATWLAAHAFEVGFVIRYPEGKEAVTGYAYEPWHLRYVGIDVARALVEDGLVLEELPG